MRSKEQIHTIERSPLMRHNRYGASAIIEAGREESQRMLMERYHRIEATHEKNNGAGILADRFEQLKVKNMTPFK